MSGPPGGHALGYAKKKDPEHDDLLPTMNDSQLDVDRITEIKRALGVSLQMPQGLPRELKKTGVGHGGSIIFTLIRKGHVQ